MSVPTKRLFFLQLFLVLPHSLTLSNSKKIIDNSRCGVTFNNMLRFCPSENIVNLTVNYSFQTTHTQNQNVEIVDGRDEMVVCFYHSDDDGFVTPTGAWMNAITCRCLH